jgi:hypothetical protein
MKCAASDASKDFTMRVRLPFPASINADWFRGDVRVPLVHGDDEARRLFGGTGFVNSKSVVIELCEWVSDDVIRAMLSGLRVRCANLSSCNLNGDIDLADIGHTQATLRVIDLSRIQNIGNPTLAALSGCPNLNTLVLSDTPLLTADGFAHLPAAAHNLTSLTITACLGVDDGAVLHISKCRVLANACLFSLPAITDKAAEHLAASSSITSVAITGCSGITDETAKHLAGMKNLLRLDLSHNHQLRDKTPEYIGAGICVKLRVLIIRVLPKLTDAAIEALAACPSLECLDASSCTGITDAATHHFTEFKKLRSLTVYGCRSMTPQTRAIVSCKYVQRGVDAWMWRGGLIMTHRPIANGEWFKRNMLRVVCPCCE